MVGSWAVEVGILCGRSAKLLSQISQKLRSPYAICGLAGAEGILPLELDEYPVKAGDLRPRRRNSRPTRFLSPDFFADDSWREMARFSLLHPWSLPTAPTEPRCSPRCVGQMGNRGGRRRKGVVRVLLGKVPEARERYQAQSGAALAGRLVRGTVPTPSILNSLRNEFSLNWPLSYNCEHSAPGSCALVTLVRQAVNLRNSEKPKEYGNGNICEIRRNRR